MHKVKRDHVTVAVTFIYHSKSKRELLPMKVKRSYQGERGVARLREEEFTLPKAHSRWRIREAPMTACHRLERSQACEHPQPFISNLPALPLLTSHASTVLSLIKPLCLLV